MANWIDYLVPIGTAGAGAAAVYGTFVRPRQRVHEQHEKERAETRRKSDAFMFGITPIEGVTDGALSAPRRLQAVETGLTTVSTGLAQNTAAVTTMSNRIDKFNGSVGRIETMASSLVDTTLTTKKALDIAAESVAEAAHQTAHELAEVAEGQHLEVLEAINPDQPAIEPGERQ
jgi:hypothetical protein